MPWGCLVAVAFLITGLALFGIHGKDASQKSQKLFDLVDSASEDYAKYFHKFDTYWMITIGLGTGSVVASIYLALAKLDLRLRKDGRKRGRENWSPWRLSCTRAGGALALLTLLSTTAWLLLNGLLLTAWGWSMLTLRDAAAPAIANYNSYILQDQTVPEISTLQTSTEFVCPSSMSFHYF